MLLLLLLLKGLWEVLAFSPLKIKILASISYIGLLLRYIILLIFDLVRSSLYLYLLKPIYFLNLAFIPVIGFITYYIFSRKDKFHFNIFFPLSIVVFIFYATSIYFFPSRIAISNLYTYIILFQKPLAIYTAYMIINLFYLVASIMLLSNENSNKLGAYMMIFASFLTILETVLYLARINLLPENIASDIFWVISLNYSISKFKKKKAYTL
jgi:hypothetical protein